MSKFIKLMTSAYVNGQLRHPHEGVLHLDDVEAKRLVDNKSGEDVTKDFDAEDRKNVPVENLSAARPAAPGDADRQAVEHQANIPPAATADSAPVNKEKSK